MFSYSCTGIFMYECRTLTNSIYNQSCIHNMIDDGERY